jgi:hypothetical protein
MNQEHLESAKMNFENLERSMPVILRHPFYLIAKSQLDSGLGYGTIEEYLGKVDGTNLLKVTQFEILKVDTEI